MFFWALHIIFGNKLSHLHLGYTGDRLDFCLNCDVSGEDYRCRPYYGIPLFGIDRTFDRLFSSLVLMSLEMAAMKCLLHKTFSILISIEQAIVAIIAFIILSEHLTFSFRTSYVHPGYRDRFFHHCWHDVAP
ncbi:hypothetical protein BG74_09430 [Sodalis-like endosymbiont of Proechinophthirus fluctus]|nr:hypothetical protein BG74_09430 [Sodalis-like endosymbiont of Proechinophthirus fluctus]